ncbi:unknown [Clostridium sp. CAG:921]|nr:unknown [Clostridium sp. CAG:921]
MNKSKIDDFINVWAEVVGLTGEENKKYRNFIKTDIARRCEMYEQTISAISTKDDSCNAYIIKPVNGQYSLEDFLLNRLMLGLREVSFTGALDGNGGEYVAHNKSLNVNVRALDSLVKNKATRHKGLQGKNVQIIQKTIEHELGHCYKTSFNDGFKAPLGRGREQDEMYKKLIDALSKFENGKYTSQIKSLKDFDLEEYSDVIKTGVGDSRAYYKYDSRFTLIDELLNETEALELTNSSDVHEIWPLQDENGRDSVSGNYVNVYNYLCGYCPFTGYGTILKSLLGKENTFRAEYISSVDIFKQFDKEYADIVQDVWGLDPQEVPPMRCIFLDFDDISSRKHFDENIMLKLDELFAKCYERKVEKIMAQENLSPELRASTLREIETFQSRLTTNKDPNKRDALVHNVIFNNLRTRINELSIQNSQPKIVEDDKSQKSVQQDNQQSRKTDSQKMKFAKGFIQAYDVTEEEYQYEKRANSDVMDIKRLQEIIETNGMNRMLTGDLDGKWIGRPGDEDFKVQYSQKQVSAMARLLKVAQLLTESKKLNPDGRDYLEEFTNVPDIEYKLKQMWEDFKDKNSYMYDLRQRARDNRANGTIPSYPPTPAETEASDSPAPEIKQDGTEQQKRLSIGNVKSSISKGMVTMQEAQSATQDIKKLMEIKRLQVMQRTGQALTPEQKRLLDGDIR